MKLNAVARKAVDLLSDEGFGKDHPCTDEYRFNAARIELHKAGMEQSRENLKHIIELMWEIIYK